VPAQWFNGLAVLTFRGKRIGCRRPIGYHSRCNVAFFSLYRQDSARSAPYHVHIVSPV